MPSYRVNNLALWLDEPESLLGKKAAEKLGVTPSDFSQVRVVRSVLRAFPAERVAAFFESLGVTLHEEEDGKLFPDTNRSRTVLDALLVRIADQHRGKHAYIDLRELLKK